MRESISISKLITLALLLGTLEGALAASAFAAPTAGPNAAGESKTTHPEEDDFRDTPFTEYGEFNEEAEEASETKFFQYGRFFGVSVGAGMEGALGNRGLLWAPAFPVLELKAHYWFDFNLSLDLGFYSAKHTFETSIANGQYVDVNLFWLGADIKYYFDTKNASAPVAFLNPFFSLGVGSFSKTQFASATGSTSAADTVFGLSFGAGTEFVLSPRKTYLILELKGHMPSFEDTNTPLYQGEPNRLDNLRGILYTTVVSLLFTW